ncbi:MAG: GNAT family N-acetyltransferase [Steroidobacteraceae bacterium]
MAGFSVPRIAEQISGGAASYWVALERGDLVGVIGISTDRRVHHLFVKESFRRRGIARALWERAETDFLSSMGEAGEVEVVVRSSLYAVPVYKQFGFEATGPAIDGAGVNFVPMRLILRNRGTTK